MVSCFLFKENKMFSLINLWCSHGRDHMVVGFKTTYTVSAYHH